MHPKFLVCAIRRPRLKLFTKQLKRQRLPLLSCFLLSRQEDLESKNGVLLRNRCMHGSDMAHDLPVLNYVKLTLKHILLSYDFEREPRVAHNDAFQTHATHTSTSNYTEQGAVHVGGG